MNWKPKDLKVVKTVDQPNIILSLFVIFGLVGCNPPPEPLANYHPWSKEQPPIQENHLGALARKDFQTLGSFDSASAHAYDQTARLRFREIFGGYEGKHIQNFIEERIKFALSDDDIRFLLKRKSADRMGRVVLPQKKEKNVTASNLGAEYWLQGLIDDSVFTLVLRDGQNIMIDSPRAGILRLGPQYASQPQIMRQAILIHEARHSDCVGGITDSDIELLSSSNPYPEIYEKLQARKCTHLHSMCKTGDYGGVPACDSETWGSYGIQLLFLKAALHGAQQGTTDWQILNAAVIDTENRLQFSFDDMIHSTTDHPELTSSR